MRALLLALAASLLACAPPPVIDSITPTQGPLAREVEVTVTGSGFDAEARLRLVGTAFSFDLVVEAVIEAQQIQARVPAGLDPASYDVVVENPDGQQGRLAAAYRALTDQLKLLVLDVGQGSALLAIGSDGTTLLFDGGKENRAASVLWPAIQHHAGGRIDAVVTSHFDIDHMGGLVGVLRGPDGTANTADDPDLPLGIWDNGRAEACTTAICARYREAAAGRNQAIALGQSFALGTATARCVAVAGKIEGGQQVTPQDDNAASVALLFEQGGARLLVSGDLPGGGLGTQDLETPLATALGPVDVWLLGHHGSASATAASALTALAPQAALISVGTDNSYCHPAAEVLQRLNAAALPTYLTGAGVTAPGGNCSQVSELGASMQVVGDIELLLDAGGQVTIAGDIL